MAGQSGEISTKSWHNRKSVPNCQKVFVPFYTSDIYDTYMDGCVLMSANHIVNPDIIISYI